MHRRSRRTPVGGSSAFKLYLSFKFYTQLLHARGRGGISLRMKVSAGVSFSGRTDMIAGQHMYDQPQLIVFGQPHTLTDRQKSTDFTGMIPVFERRSSID